MKTTLLIFVLTLNGYLYSQEIFVCREYTLRGEPKGASENWYLQSDNDTLNILFNFFDYDINTKNLLLFIDFVSDNGKTPVLTKKIELRQVDSWIVIPFSFSKEGKYSIKFMDGNNIEVAEKEIKVYFTLTQSVSQEIHAKTYYRGAEIHVCEIVLNGKPANYLRELSLSDQGGKIFIYINNRNPLNTSYVFLNVYKKTEDGNFNELVEKKKFRMQPHWADVFFKYKIPSHGTYLFDVLNDNLTKIAYTTLKVYE